MEAVSRRGQQTLGQDDSTDGNFWILPGRKRYDHWRGTRRDTSLLVQAHGDTDGCGRANLIKGKGSRVGKMQPQSQSRWSLDTEG